MQQRQAIVSPSVRNEQDQKQAARRSAPVALTEAELAQVSGGGPNGNWAIATRTVALSTSGTFGPNGNW
ncbi:hypothetical protein BH11PSE8_BH11PSE8_38270 [soil metagenome]